VAVDAGENEQGKLSLSNQDYARRAELQVKRQDLRLERSRMASGTLAISMVSGGIVTFLLTSMIAGTTIIVIGAIMGLYYLVTASALDSRIAATENDLRNLVAQAAPPRAPQVAVHRLTVARF
jgi:hypothetical protein